MTENDIARTAQCHTQLFLQLATNISNYILWLLWGVGGGGGGSRSLICLECSIFQPLALK